MSVCVIDAFSFSFIRIANAIQFVIQIVSTTSKLEEMNSRNGGKIEIDNWLTSLFGNNRFGRLMRRQAKEKNLIIFSSSCPQFFN